HHMLHFLENHDEQRIASTGFAGNAPKGMPAMVVSATISTAPTMIYFGQELGEAATEDLGFGDATRTSIFDYGSVPSYVRWVNDKKFDGGQSTPEEKELRDFYKRLLNFTINSPALMGEYRDLHAHNREHTQYYGDDVLSFVRYSESDRLIIITNFSNEHRGFDLQIPTDIVQEMKLQDGMYAIKDQLYDNKTADLQIKDGKGTVRIDLDGLESVILRIED
ncbi:MAG: alpha-amylase, partial [Nonlabens sp.]